LAKSVTVKPPSLTHRTISSMAWTAWGSAATGGLKIVVLVVLTRLLSPADFGLVGAALVVIGFSLAFSQLGMGPALVQRPVLEPRHISTAFFASTGFGLLVAALVWLLAPQIAAFFRMDKLVPVVRVLAVLFPVVGVSSVAENLLQRDLRFRLLANTDVFAYSVGYGVVGFGTALLGFGPWALVSAQITQAVLRATVIIRAEPPRLHPAPSWVCFKDLMGFGAGLSAARLGVILANQADNLVVGRWLGAVALGLYSRAYQLMSVPTALLGDVFDRVLFPTMSRVQDEPRRLTSAYLQGTAVVALVTLPAGLVAAVVAPELVAVAFGSRWQTLVAPFQVLALGMMFRTSYRMSDSLSRATGRVYSRAWRQALYAALVFLGAWAGQRQGITGVAVGVLGALFINYLLMAHLGLGVLQIPWLSFMRAQLPALWLAMMVGVATLATMVGTRHLRLPPLPALLAGVVAAAGTAMLAAMLAPRFVLGEHGIRMRDTLRAYWITRIHPTHIRESA
jgi:O-antigen/teichoic acid export membrane protein